MACATQKHLTAIDVEKALAAQEAGNQRLKNAAQNQLSRELAPTLVSQE